MILSEEYLGSSLSPSLMSEGAVGVEVPSESVVDPVYGGR